MSKSMSLATAGAAPKPSIIRQDTWLPVFLAIAMRISLFALMQGFVALIFVLQQHPQSWDASIRWWPLSAALANVVCLAVLTSLRHRQGQVLVDLYRVEKHAIRRDALISIGLMVIGTPLAIVPNVMLGNWLFGDVARTGDFLLRPLPAWGLIIAALVFPLTNALSELPTYFAYAMPRIERISGRPWLALALPAFFLAAQHITLPLVFDARFILWRLGMFMPFAFFIAFCLRRRPSILPYFMLLHGLMDLQLILMIPAV